MAETHELRLKINAAAARAGAREFVSAIRTIQNAIEGLDQRSAAAFTRIHDKAKGTASAFGLLVSQYGTARIANERFAASIAKTNAALQRQLILAKQARGGLSGPNPATQPRMPKPSTGSGDRQTERMARAQLAAAQAMRQAEQDAVRLKNRLSALGDTRGITAVDQALLRLRSSLSGVSDSSLKVRQAMSQFQNVTTSVKVALTQAEGAQMRSARAAREMAGSQRDAANAARRVEREMRSISGAGNAVSQAMRNATGSMRGLENAFSGTFQVGSAFRTLIGSITFGTFIQSVFAAGTALNQFRTTMEVATGSTAGAMQQMDFIDGMARELGTNLRTAREDFAKFAVAANLAGVETETARDIFQSVSQAMTVMGRGTEDQRLAFLALEQMLSKNTISSEELRRQLGERLPGAVSLMARAVGVTTTELQKLLQAGSLVSSEVLPKFAKEVDRAFGPGLERALTRAPAALGRFSNEVEFFLSAIADSGVMDSLASGFDQLTRAMRAPEARESAEKLGQGLADLAEISFDFAQMFIENVDTIGTVAKAVIGGIVVRQAILMGNALLTGATRSTAAFAQLTASMSANTAALTAHTAALTQTTAGTTAVTTAQVRQTAASTAQTAATLRANIALTATPGIAARSAAALSAMSRAAAGAASGMTMVSRAVVGLAGPIGIAVTALSLLPLLFGDAEKSAVDMADEIDAAVRRAGTSLDELASRDYTSASRSTLDGLTSDIAALEGRLDYASKSQERFEHGFNQMRRVMANFNREASQSSIFVRRQNALLSAVNMSREALRGLGDTSRHVVSQTLAVGEAAARGETSWLAYYRAIERAMAVDPNSSAILERLQEEARKNAEAELAVAAHREQLILLFGTDDDKATTRFAQMALAALNAGEGLDSLQKQIKETQEQAPRLANRMKAVLSEIRTSFAQGVSLPEIRVGLGDDLGNSADEIIRLRAEMEKTARVASSFQADFKSGVGSFMNRFQIDGVGSEGLSEIKAILNDFSQFNDASVPLENLRIILDEMHFPTEDAERFADAVQQQFSTLSPAQQTYDNFRRIVGQVAQEFQTAGTSIGPFSQSLADTVRATTDASRTSEDLRGSLTGLLVEYGLTAEEAESATKWLYESADGATDAGRAATDAESGFIAAANGLDHIADGAVGAANQIHGVIAALNALGATAAGVPKAAAKIVDDINFAAMQKAAPVWERKRNAFVREHMDKAKNEYESGMRAAGEAGAGFLIQGIESKYADTVAAIESGGKSIEEASKNLYNTEGWKDPNRGGRKGGSGGRKKSGGGKDDPANAAERLTKAVKALTEGLDGSLESLESQNNSLALLASGYTTSERAARLLGEAQQQGLNIFDNQTLAMVRQIEAAEKLNKALTRLANDPVNDWMNSVPTWREAGQQIETGVLNHLSDTISNFIKTGEFSFEALGDAILGTVADIVADKAVKELVTLFGGNTTGSGEGGFGLGGFLSNLFGGGSGSIGDDPDPFASGLGGNQSATMQNAMVSGGQQAAQAIQTAMVQAGQQVGQQITTGGQQAGAQMSSQVQTAGSVAGTQMSTQTMTGGAVAGTSMMTNTQTGGQIAASQMQNAIMQGGASAASQMAAATAGGGGGGGFFGGGMGGILLGAGLGLLGSIFSKKKSEPSGPKDPETPVGIRQYAEGTANTSGIPAILHDNEAVIPLSKGRKVPVDFGDDLASKRGNKTVVQNFNIQTPDADSFRKSQKQIAADAATSGRKALIDNG